MEQNKTPWTIGYKEVKNFMHNELGITKEEMNEIITKIVRDEVADTVGQNGEFIRQSIREIIRQEMMYAINSQKYPRRTRNIWDYTEMDDFRKFISDIMKEEILETIRSQFEVSFDFTKK